jgi:uncharacterized protein (DUF736 family)
LPYEKNPLELGQLWAKTGQKGDYLTGEVNGIKVVCFPVNSENPKAPTWRVMKSKPKDASVPDAGHNLNAPPVDAGDIPF